LSIARLLPRLIESLAMDSEARESFFESLYTAHSADVLRYAVRRGVGHPDAEEIVEETFLVCWRRLDEVPDPPLPWLLGVARRILSNGRRTERRLLALRSKLSMTRPDPPPAPLVDSAQHEVVRRALASLGDADREVLELLMWQGLTHDAAAAVLGCSRNAVTKRFQRACRSLKALLPADRTYI
jgi:RNA polymerase sigma-70 factor (ECF subfamily)